MTPGLQEPHGHLGHSECDRARSPQAPEWHGSRQTHRDLAFQHMVIPCLDPHPEVTGMGPSWQCPRVGAGSGPGGLRTSAVRSQQAAGLALGAGAAGPHRRPGHPGELCAERRADCVTDSSSSRAACLGLPEGRNVGCGDVTWGSLGQEPATPSSRAPPPAPGWAEVAVQSGWDPGALRPAGGARFFPEGIHQGGPGLSLSLELEQPQNCGSASLRRSPLPPPAHSTTLEKEPLKPVSQASAWPQFTLLASAKFVSAGREGV